MACGGEDKQAAGAVPERGPLEVTISADAITFGGKEVADPVAVTENPEPLARIDALYEALWAVFLARTDAGNFEDPADRTVIIRANHRSPSKVVFLVANTIGAANFPYLGFDIGSGHVWEKGFRPTAATLRPREAVQPALIEEEYVRCSVLLTSRETWVGLSRIQDFRQLMKVDGGHDWRLLEMTLVEHKKSSFFSAPNPHHDEIEVGAEDDVYFEDLVKAMTVAVKAGFPRVYLTSPHAMVAKPQL